MIYILQNGFDLFSAGHRNCYIYNFWYGRKQRKICAMDYAFAIVIFQGLSIKQRSAKSRR